MATTCADTNQPAWLELRQQLWPHCTAQEHLAEMKALTADPARFAQFIDYDPSGKPLGLVEVALRTDYVNGTETTPVAFLEGIYVLPQARRKGVARKLVSAAVQWAVGHGCAEIASDAQLENTTSHAMHAGLGFVETERVVFFKRVLR